MPRYRVIRTSHLLGEDSEDVGAGLTVPTRSDEGTEIVWEDDLDQQPNSKRFAELGVQIFHDSRQEEGEEPDTGTEGDVEYSYNLECQVGGKWVWCDALSPPGELIEPSSPYWEHPDD